MDKLQLTKELKVWFGHFLENKFSDDYNLLDVFIPETVLSKINNDHLKKIPGYSSWDFNPDIVAILENKNNSDIQIAILNRSTSSISLREIGEVNLYAKLSDALLAFLVSPKGISSEVSLLLVDDQIRDRLLSYNENKNLIIFSWNENSVDGKSIVPIKYKSFLL